MSDDRPPSPVSQRSARCSPRRTSRDSSGSDRSKPAPNPPLGSCACQRRRSLWSTSAAACHSTCRSICVFRRSRQQPLYLAKSASVASLSSFNRQIAAISQLIAAAEDLQHPHRLRVRRLIPWSARGPDNQEWSEESVVDRSLQPVLLSQPALTRGGHLPLPVQLPQGNLRRRLDAQFLAIDVDARSALRLTQNQVRDIVAVMSYCALLSVRLASTSARS